MVSMLWVLMAPCAAHEALGQNLRLAVDSEGQLSAEPEMEEKIQRLIGKACKEGQTIEDCRKAAEDAVHQLEDKLSQKTDAIQHLDVAAEELAHMAQSANEGADVSVGGSHFNPSGEWKPQAHEDTETRPMASERKTSIQKHREAMMVKHGSECDPATRQMCKPMGSSESDIKNFDSAVCAPIYDMDGEKVLDKQGEHVHQCQGCEADCESGGIVDPGAAGCGRAACAQCNACWCMFPQALSDDDRLSCTALDSHYLTGPENRRGDGTEHGLRVGEKCHPTCKRGYHLRSAGWPDQFDGDKNSNVYMTCEPPQQQESARFVVGRTSPEDFTCDPDHCDMTVPENASAEFINDCHGRMSFGEQVGDAISINSDKECKPSCDSGFHVEWVHFEKTEAPKTNLHRYKLLCKLGTVHVVDDDTGVLQNLEPTIETFKCVADVKATQKTT